MVLILSPILILPLTLGLSMLLVSGDSGLAGGFLAFMILFFLYAVFFVVFFVMFSKEYRLLKTPSDTDFQSSNVNSEKVKIKNYPSILFLIISIPILSVINFSLSFRILSNFINNGINSGMFIILTLFTPFIMTGVEIYLLSLLRKIMRRLASRIPIRAVRS